MSKEGPINKKGDFIINIFCNLLSISALSMHNLFALDLIVWFFFWKQHFSGDDEDSDGGDSEDHDGHNMIMPSVQQWPVRNQGNTKKSGQNKVTLALSTHVQYLWTLVKKKLLTLQRRQKKMKVIVSGELKREHKQVILYSPDAAVHNTPKLRVRINKFPCQACEI